MYQGWGTVTTQILLFHRRAHMEVRVTAKLCGWCRRQARRTTTANNPNIVVAPFWDQELFNRLARYQEISMVATGLDVMFPTVLYRINRVWVHQTCRIINYPALERFNFD